MRTVQVYRSGKNHLTLQINTVKLEALQKALGIKYRAEVGILGASPHNRKMVGPRMETVRSASGKGRPSQTMASSVTNAMIGAAHEFGVKNTKGAGWRVPPRSFLWMPLTMHLMEFVNAKADVINKKLNMAEVHGCYELLGIIAENVVQEAFKTEGWGAWPKLKPITIQRKGSDHILIDTGQLRKSITSRVVS